jgi:hypothetical protein
MSSSTPSRSCWRSLMIPLISSSGIINSRIKRAIAPSFRVRLRFMGLSLFGWGEFGICMWRVCGGNVETLWRVFSARKTTPHPNPPETSDRPKG